MSSELTARSAPLILFSEELAEAFETLDQREADSATPAPISPSDALNFVNIARALRRDIFAAQLQFAKQRLFSLEE